MKRSRDWIPKKKKRRAPALRITTVANGRRTVMSLSQVQVQQLAASVVGIRDVVDVFTMGAHMVGAPLPYNLANSRYSYFMEGRTDERMLPILQAFTRRMEELKGRRFAEKEATAGAGDVAVDRIVHTTSGENISATAEAGSRDSVHEGANRIVGYPESSAPTSSSSTESQLDASLPRNSP